MTGLHSSELPRRSSSSSPPLSRARTSRERQAAAAADLDMRSPPSFPSPRTEPGDDVVHYHPTQDRRASTGQYFPTPSTYARSSHPQGAPGAVQLSSSMQPPLPALTYLSPLSHYRDDRPPSSSSSSSLEPVQSRLRSGSGPSSYHPVQMHHPPGGPLLTYGQPYYPPQPPPMATSSSSSSSARAAAAAARPSGLPAPRPVSSADAAPPPPTPGGSATSSERKQSQREERRPSREEDVQRLLKGFSGVRDDRRYELHVVQNPTRARMCGFGDKDRRPLSPTLIVRLYVIDVITGRQIPPSEVNSSLFFLAADLCHPDDMNGTPKNLLVHRHSTAQIYGAQHHYVQPSEARPPSSEARPPAHHSEPFGPGQQWMFDYDPEFRPTVVSEGTGEMHPPPRFTPGSVNAPPFHVPSPHHPYAHSPMGPPPPPGRASLPSLSSLELPGQPPRPQPPAYAHAPPPPPPSAESVLLPATTESYTRNLVGSSVASANALYDDQGDHGIFFVLQDISVRTEGVYRLRLTFASLELNGRINTGTTSALAECYTEPFTVYSPRKFPGMVDPTPLSRKLASQGVKIPVRNDKKKRKKADTEFDDGEVEPEPDVQTAAAMGDAREEKEAGDGGGGGVGKSGVNGARQAQAQAV